MIVAKILPFALVLACSNSSQFSNAEKPAVEKDANSATEDSFQQSVADDDEDESVQVPVMISGAFLTVGCGWSPSSYPGTGRDAECVLRNRDNGKKYDGEERGWKVDWFIRSSPAVVVNASFDPLPKQHRHHVRVNVPSQVYDTSGWVIGATLVSPDGENEEIALNGATLGSWPVDRLEPVSFPLAMQWKVSDRGVDSTFKAAEWFSEIFSASETGLCDANGQLVPSLPERLGAAYSAQLERYGNAFDSNEIAEYLLNPTLERDRVSVGSSLSRKFCTSDLGTASTDDFLWLGGFGHFRNNKQCIYVVYSDVNSTAVGRIGVFQVPGYIENAAALMARLTPKTSCSNPSLD